jgi:3-phosphoshikimate 1-carboxyvinyltransferase
MKLAAEPRPGTPPMLPDPLPIQPLAGPFRATVRPPGSKSLTNRALILAALADGASTLRGVLFSDDTKYMMAALERLGFQLEVDPAAETVTVHGEGGRIPAESADLFCGNSGTSIRFLTALCCLGKGTYTLDGIERMRKRPIGPLVDALRQIGARIEYIGDDGYPPLRIDACALVGGDVTIDPTLSSQFVTALMQVGPYCHKGLRIHFEGNPVSRPYLEMSDALIARFSHQVNDPRQRYHYEPRPYSGMDWAIEPDASNASYFLAAAAVTPGASATVLGLHADSVQGDARFHEVLAEMGCAVRVDTASITVEAAAHLGGPHRALNDMPDMAQTLAVVALFAEGETVIRDVGNLRVKETDRMAAIKNECEKLGATVVLDGDDIHITPPAGNVLRHPDGVVIDDDHPVFIDTYDDHRMAMSFAVAGLRQAGVRINDPACVNKTYPRFFDDMEKLRQGVAAT